MPDDKRTAGIKEPESATAHCMSSGRPRHIKVLQLNPGLHGRRASQTSYITLGDKACMVMYNKIRGISAEVTNTGFT